MPLGDLAYTAGGLRENMSRKQNGYFGMLDRPDGDFSTELSFGFNSGGKEMLAPLLVPGLTLGEINHLLSGAEPTREIYDKAQSFALDRLRSGKPTFARPNEVFPLPARETP